MELCWSLESNYLLFSDKFRVNHIFFKEKQAVVSGGSRDQHQHWFSRVRRLICITRNPKQEFLEFLQQYLQPSFPFVLGVKELCSHSQLQATGTEQGWQSLSKVSVRVPAAPGCGLQVQVLCQAQGVLDRSWPLPSRDPVRMCKGHNRAETAHESHLRPLVNVFAAQEHACDSFFSLTQLTLALAVMFCQCLPWSHTCVSRNELLSPQLPSCHTLPCSAIHRGEREAPRLPRGSLACCTITQAVDAGFGIALSAQPCPKPARGQPGAAAQAWPD